MRATLVVGVLTSFQLLALPIHAARGPDAEQEENEGEEVPRGEGATVSGNGYAGQLAFPNNP